MSCPTPTDRNSGGRPGLAGHMRARDLSLSLILVVAGCSAAPETLDAVVRDALVVAPDGASADAAPGAGDAGAVDTSEASDGGLDDATAVDTDADVLVDAVSDAAFDASPDASPDADAAPATDAGPSAALTPCATRGTGAIVAPAGCVTFTAVEAGADARGDNATDAEYALEPGGTAEGALVVYLNASLSSPARQIADPTENFYSAAAGAGFHVLALTYRSSLVVGATCSNDAACFALARQSIVLGQAAPAAPRAVANIREDEGIVPRLDAALRLLAAARPGQGWEQFLAAPTAPTAAARIDWSRVIAAGHSQGGGHAAFLGKLFPLRRVVQLASTCDAVSTTPAPWTQADSTWATDPAQRYVGLAAAGDTICPHHVAVWQAMGLAPARQHDDAELCGGAEHAGPIMCTDNFARWPTLLR